MDGRPNHEIRAVFSNFSDLVWKEQENQNSQQVNRHFLTIVFARFSSDLIK